MKAITRRRFLRRSAVIAGTIGLAPSIIPSTALGRGDRAAPSERINVGMIGMGRQAYLVNMKQFLAMPDVQVTAICDVDSWRLEQARKAIDKAYHRDQPAERLKSCVAFEDYREILARDDVDAVMISTPDHWHAAMASAALSAGKDVSLEKPITRTIAEGRKLTSLAKKFKRVFRVDSELRSKPSTYRAAELVRNGIIGKVRRVIVGVPGSDVGCPAQPEMPVPDELDYERWQGPAPRAPYTLNRVHPRQSYGRPGWMRHLFYCDGMITNWGTHLNDGAMWCTNLERTGPTEIEGTGTYPGPASFWNVLLRFDVRYRFANGVEWIYKTDKPYFRIEGEEGWIQGGFSALKAEPAVILDSGIPIDGVRFRRKSDKRDFIDCVKSRAETLEPAEVGHRVTSLCHLGHIAIQVREKLRFDPARERFIGNEDANAWLAKPIQSATVRGEV